jgi:hypothetical protein
MNGKTGGNRGPRRAAALAVAAAVAVLTTACGVVQVHFGSSGGSAPAGSATYRAELAYAQCMRAHGLPGFPNPNPSGGPSFHYQLNGNPNSPAARANDACKHLLPGGRTGAAADCLASRPPCYTPRQLRVGYGIQPLLDRGITGRGQTVVLPEFPPSAAGSPSGVTGVQVPAVTDIRQDLARFDALFGLPAARLQVVNTLAHAARVVVFQFDTSRPERFWLTRDYLPEFSQLAVGRPSLTKLAGAIGAHSVPVLIPWDCMDGFFHAYWRRPEAYLRREVRRGTSVWRRVGATAENRAVRALRADLASGRWTERNQQLMGLDAADLGARLVIA